MSSPMTERGYISAYFLAALLFIFTLNGIILLNLDKRSMTVANMMRENEYLTAETKAIRDLQCRIANGEEFTSPVYLTVEGPRTETLVIELKNGKVWDYTCIRNENGQP